MVRWPLYSRVVLREEKGENASSTGLGGEKEFRGHIPGFTRPPELLKEKTAQHQR